MHQPVADLVAQREAVDAALGPEVEIDEHHAVDMVRQQVECPVAVARPVDLQLLAGTDEDGRVHAAPFFRHAQWERAASVSQFLFEFRWKRVVTVGAGGQERAEHEAVHRPGWIGHGQADDAHLLAGRAGDLPHGGHSDGQAVGDANFVAILCRVGEVDQAVLAWIRPRGEGWPG